MFPMRCMQALWAHLTRYQGAYAVAADKKWSLRLKGLCVDSFKVEYYCLVKMFRGLRHIAKTFGIPIQAYLNLPLTLRIFSLLKLCQNDG
jgi:hypothetical protein